MKDFWRRNSPFLAALAFVVFFLVLIYTSTQTQADRVYKAATEVCARSNQTREELNDLYSAFEVHNSITGDLFSIVGESLVGDNDRAAKAFTRFSVQYRAIAHEYDNIKPIDCERVIARP